MPSNPGSVAGAIPDGPDALVRQQRDLERQAQEDAAARGLASSEIGNGGELLVKGSLRVTGSITVPGTLASAGAITAGTTVTATGNVIAGGDLRGTDAILTGYLYSPAGYAFDVTYTRRAAWLGNDGRLGWASSSITAKELLDTIPEPDALTILKITSHHYHRRAELEKRDNPKSDEYYGSKYRVATEWGAIAEELHELGLWQVVIYEWETVWDLRDVLDDEGEPIRNEQGWHLKERVPGSERRVKGSKAKPIGIHYEMLGLLAIVAGRFIWDEHSKLVQQLREKGVID